MKTRPWSVLLTLGSALSFFCAMSFGLVALLATGWVIWQVPIASLPAKAGLGLGAYLLILYVGFTHGALTMLRRDEHQSQLIGALVWLDYPLLLAGMFAVFFIVTRTDGPVLEVLGVMAVIGLLASALGICARHGYDRAARYLEPCELPLPQSHATDLDAESNIIYVDPIPEQPARFGTRRASSTHRPVPPPQPVTTPVGEPQAAAVWSGVRIVSADELHFF